MANPKSRKSKGESLDALQKLVLEHYCRGEFAHVSTPEEVSECGDSLVGFLMSELSTNSDCENVSMAVHRLGNAISELEQLKSRLEQIEN